MAYVVVDHINTKSFDNRLENLVVTQKVNTQNKTTIKQNQRIIHLGIWGYLKEK
jgi:hypothetical protein